MKKEIRVLQILGGLNMGGIENFIMNIYRNIDKNKVQFDFLIHQEEEQIFEEEIKKLGGNVYRISSIKKVGYFKYKKELRKFLKKNRYKIVHSHYNELSGLILKVAKKCGIRNRIAHSHIAYPSFSTKLLEIVSKYLRMLLKEKQIIKFACSQKAGEWLYEKKSNFKIVNNGIEPLKYKFSIEKRNQIRKVLSLKEEEIAIGHIGRLTNQKNHKFLIEIFNELLKLNLNYKLFLIGNGELEKNIRKQVKDLNLENRVILLGVRKNVNELLQAFDLFIFPSLYEGLPVTLVEAQGAGLKCFISDSVTKEIDLECGLTEFISLNKSAQEWAEIIDDNKEYKRKNTIEALRKHGYDMTQNAKELENLYIELHKNS